MEIATAALVTRGAAIKKKKCKVLRSPLCASSLRTIRASLLDMMCVGLTKRNIEIFLGRLMACVFIFYWYFFDCEGLVYGGVFVHNVYQIFFFIFFFYTLHIWWRKSYIRTSIRYVRNSIYKFSSAVHRKRIKFMTIIESHESKSFSRKQ